MKLKKGDIVLNRWAGNVQYRYFIFTGKTGKYVHGIECIDGRLSKTKYYTHSLDEPFSDGEPAYKVVGYTDAFEVMKANLKDVQNMELKRCRNE